MQVIVDKMVDYLRTTNDEATKTEVVRRIGELAERFAPDTQWFLDTMNQVCCCSRGCRVVLVVILLVYEYMPQCVLNGDFMLVESRTTCEVMLSTNKPPSVSSSPCCQTSPGRITQICSGYSGQSMHRVGDKCCAFPMLPPL